MADVITRLKIDSGEYESKIARAVSGLKRMEEECRNVGGTLSRLEKDQLEYVRSLGQMQTVSNSVRGKIGELSSAYVELRAQYNRLTEEERKSPFGRALSGSLDQLKQRIGDSKKELAGIQQELSGSKFGQFGSIIDGIGKKMGLNANLTELLTSRTALMSAGIGASIAVLGKATSSWVSYNKELSRQGNITTVTTGLKGEGADRMTDQARAMADTYGVDFRDTINAANTLMTQFGQSGDAAMKLIREGMQGMIKGDGPKLLSMIQQYAPSFRDAGISASQLVAIIQNSEGGIFTDQNMNAIVMGIKNIRLMTKATSEALARLGIDGQEMTRKLNDGSITIFQALKQVSNAVQSVGSGSQAAGEVMQQVFGRQGAAAGTKLGEAIATLNTNLEETKKQTGELGDAYDELYEANVKLNKAIRDCFEYDGWEQMATGIKANLVSALASVVEQLAKVRKGLSALLRDVGLLETPKPPVFDNYVGNKTLDYIRQGKTKEERQKRYDQTVASLQRTYSNADKPVTIATKNSLTEIAKTEREGDDIRISAIRGIRTLQAKKDELIAGEKPELIAGEKPVKTNNPPKGVTTPRDTKPKKEELTIQQQISVLEKEAMTASEDRRKEIAQVVQALDKELERQKAVKDELHGIVRESKEEIEARKVLEAATKRLADAQAKLAEAEGTGSATAIFKARENVEKQQQALERVKDPSFPAPTQATGFAALVQTVEGEIKFDQMKVDENTLHSLLQTSIKNSLTGLDEEFAALFNRIPEGVDDADWQGLIDKINEQLKTMGIEPIEINFKTGSIDKVNTAVATLSKNTQQAGSAMSTLGGAIGSLEDPSAKVAGLVMQAIGNVALSFSQAMATPKDPWSWIAFAAAGTATMISTIAAIHSATGYAQGGIVDGRGGGFVGGTAYSGDNIGNVRLDAGELVLNRSQQNNLATALRTDGENSGMRLYAVVKGEDIYLSQMNYRNRTGKGEYVKTRR